MTLKYVERAAGTPEYIQVLDERTRDYITAWLRAWKKQETKRLINAVTFNAVTTTKTSDSIFVAPYSDFLLLINLDVTLAPTDITLSVEFSYDNINFFKYMRTPFGSLMYEDSAGDLLECIEGKILAPWMRVKAVATGTTATALFTLTLDAVLNG